MYSVHYTVQTTYVQCTLYSTDTYVQCTLYSTDTYVQCTLYSTDQLYIYELYMTHNSKYVHTYVPYFTGNSSHLSIRLAPNSSSYVWH